MADENKQNSQEEMDVEEDAGTSTPPVPGTPPANYDTEKNLSSQESLLKKSVSSLPAAFGRSSSMVKLKYSKNISINSITLTLII